MSEEKKEETTADRIARLREDEWWKRHPHDGDQLVELVTSQLPEATAEIRVPDAWDKRWFIDFRYKQNWVVAEWKRVRHPEKFAGYGVSLNTEDTGYGEGPDHVFKTMSLAAVNAVKLLINAPVAAMFPRDRVLEGLFASWLFIANTSMASSSNEDFKVIHCHHCDEFMEDAVWPNHGNPECVAKVAMDAVWAGITAFAEQNR